MADVIFYEAFEEEALRMQHHANDMPWTAIYTAQTIQEAGHTTPPAPIISLRTQSVIPIEWSSQLKGILSRSAGYDHLTAYRSVTQTNLPCAYLPEYCVRAVAEQALMLTLGLARKLPRQVQQFKAFHRDGITGTELAGRTAAVFGVGNIGREIVHIAEAMQMNVIGVDPVQRFNDVAYKAPEEALAMADVIYCSMNLNDTNNGYFNRERLAQVKRGALLINTARGEMTPALEMQPLLDDGTLGGLGLDVYNEEGALAVALRQHSEPESDELKALLAISQRDNVILTPHNAFNTTEAVERKAEQSIRQVDHFLKSGDFIWPIPES